MRESEKLLTTADHQRPPAKMGFGGQFHGSGREAPDDYIEDVLIAAMSAAAGDGAMQERVAKSYFRTGLRGEARKWYDRLADEEKEWGRLQSTFTARFKRRTVTQNMGLAAQVNAFTRRQDETLVAYVRRATTLHDQISGQLRKDLRDRLLSRMTDNGHEEDQVLQARVTDRMFLRDLIDDAGRFTEEADFDKVREMIIAATIVPGQDSNPFFDEPEMEDVRAPTTTEQVLLQAVGLMKEVQERAMTPVAYQTPPYPVNYAAPHPTTSQVDQPPSAVTGHGGGYSNVYHGSGNGVQFNAQSNQTHHQKGGATQRKMSGDWRVRPNTPFSQKRVTCWNCGHDGHGSKECNNPMQAAEVRAHIRQLCLDGRPVPEEYKYKTPQSSGNPAETTVVDGKMAFAAVASTRVTELTDGDSDDDTSFAKDLGREYALMEESKGLPANLGKNKRRRTRADSEDEDVVVSRDGGPSRLSGGRQDSPHPNTQRSQTLSQAEAEAREAKEELQRMREAFQKQFDRKKKPGPVPIRAMEGREGEGFDLEKEMRSGLVTMNWIQLFDLSPVLRRRFAELIKQARATRGRGKTRKTPGKRAASMKVASMLSGLTVHDHALPETVTSQLAFVKGETAKCDVEWCLVDSGALVDLISPQTAKQLGVPVRDADPTVTLVMADDSEAVLTKYVIFPLVVGGVVSMIRAYVTGQQTTYNLLLSRCWLVRNSATINYRSGELRIRGVKGYESVVALRHRDERVPLCDLPKSAVFDDRASSDSDDEDDGSTTDSTEDYGDEDSELEDVACKDELLDMAEFVSKTPSPKN